MKYVILLDNFAGHYTFYAGEVISETDKTIKVSTSKKIRPWSMFRSRIDKTRERYLIVDTEKEIYDRWEKYWTAKKENDRINQEYREFVKSLISPAVPSSETPIKVIG